MGTRTSLKAHALRALEAERALAVHVDLGPFIGRLEAVFDVVEEAFDLGGEASRSPNPRPYWFGSSRTPRGTDVTPTEERIPTGFASKGAPRCPCISPAETQTPPTPVTIKHV